MSRIEGGNNYEKMYKMSTTLRRFARWSCKNAMIAVQWRKYANF